MSKEKTVKDPLPRTVKLVLQGYYHAMKIKYEGDYSDINFDDSRHQKLEEYFKKHSNETKENYIPSEALYIFTKYYNFDISQNTIHDEIYNPKLYELFLNQLKNCNKFQEESNTNLDQSPNFDILGDLFE